MSDDDAGPTDEDARSEKRSEAAAQVTARAHPAWEPALPKPIPAAQGLPDWLRAAPAEAPSAALGGAAVRTVKRCPPFLDAMSLGLLIPLAADLAVTRGPRGPVFTWDWDPPATPDQLYSRAPIGAHVAEQGTGTPFDLGDGRQVLKFMKVWTLETPPGWSLLFVHPMNRADLPFYTLSGLVDCDGFSDGLVHFPALWTDDGFEGVLPAGTPVAQAIAVPRAQPTLSVETQGPARQAATRAVQAALQSEPGVYRKRHRRRQEG